MKDLLTGRLLSLLLSPQTPTNPVQRRVRELVRFTEQLQRVHPNVLAKALSRGIVHQDQHLVVVSKPYGLPVHGEECVETVQLWKGFCWWKRHVLARSTNALGGDTEMVVHENKELKLDIA